MASGYALARSAVQPNLSVSAAASHRPLHWIRGQVRVDDALSGGYQMGLVCGRDVVCRSQPILDSDAPDSLQGAIKGRSLTPLLDGPPMQANQNGILLITSIVIVKN